MLLVKRILLFLVGAILLLLLVLGGFAYFRPDALMEVINPEVSAKIHRVGTLNGQSASLDVQLTLKNKTPIPLQVKEIYFVVHMDGEEIIKSAKPFSINIRPFQKNKLIIPTEMRVAELKKTSQEFNPKHVDSARYVMAIHYNMKTFLGISDSSVITKEFHMQKMGLPGARIGNVELVGSNLKRQRVRVNINLVNPNPNDIIIENPRYTVDFNNKKDFLTGNLGKKIVLKASSFTPKSIELEIENKKIFNVIGGIIGKSDKLPLRLGFTGNLVSDSEFIKECEIQLEVNGDLRTLLQAAKNAKKK